MRTKQEIARESRDKYAVTIQRTGDGALEIWSRETHDTLKVLEGELDDIKYVSKRLEAERSATRVAYKRDSNPETLAAWHESVARSNACQGNLKSKRIERNEVQALADLLAKEVRARREHARRSHSLASEQRQENANIVDQDNLRRLRNLKSVESKQDTGDTLREEKIRKSKSKRRHETSKDGRDDDRMCQDGFDTEDKMVENCPFCSHRYTVRDGTYNKLNAIGEPMQLWKCQCREMAPPCRNCPQCKENPELMAVDADEQLALCREKEECDICSCECPGGGKWIEGDERSRERYKKKAAERYKKLNGLLKASWDGKEADINPAGDQELPKRLPADIRNQLDAAQTLLKVLDEDNKSEDDCHAKNCIACKDHHT